MQPMHANAIAERLGAALRSWTSSIPNAHKRVSRWIDVHPRNFKTYVTGRWNPPLTKAIELAAICPEYADTLFDIIDERRRALNWSIAAERVSNVRLEDVREWFSDVRSSARPDVFVLALADQNDAGLLCPDRAA